MWIKTTAFLVSLVGVAMSGVIRAEEPASRPATNVASSEQQTPVTLRLLGAGKKAVPLPEVDVVVTEGYGEDQKKFGPYRTNTAGDVSFKLAPGFYSLHLTSKKEWPYLTVEEVWTGRTRAATPSLDLRVTKDGAEKWLDGKARDAGPVPGTLTYTLLPACELVLRAVDADTGKGLPGAEFYTENALGEEWAHAIEGHNLGFPDKAPAEAQQTDKNGDFRRFVGATGGYAYGVERAPEGYEAVDAREIDLDIPFGKPKAEHVFKFRRKP